MKRLVLLTLFGSTSIISKAQERDDYYIFDSSSSLLRQDEQEPMIEVDTTLFRTPTTFGSDSYADATRYYRVQGASRRRGLYYTTSAQVVEPRYNYFQLLEEPLPTSGITLYTSKSNYRLAVRASHAQLLDRDWSLDASLWSQTGRDMFVDGVFRNTLSPEITLTKRFADQHFLLINTSLYYSMRGMQNGSTPEVFELVGTNYYNPNWGLYNGEVRNSRVRQILSPDFSLHYQYPIGGGSTLIVESQVDYSQQATSALGWYNAPTPIPDYYSKLPSALPEGEIRDYVSEIWRTNDVSHTQINWDELVRLNSIALDGNALYLLEDRVSQRFDYQLSALIHTEVGERLTLLYGVERLVENDRNFKQINDLLGADHFVDYDQFLGDNYNKTLPLQNNLLSPDNTVLQGESFGYDYSIDNSLLNALLRLNLRTSQLDISFEGEVGRQSLYRLGHFEKERFEGAASLGKSTVVEYAPYNIRLSVGHALSPLCYIALKALSCRLSLNSSSVFINETASNYLVPTISGERINSLSLSFRFNKPSFTLYGELYALSSRNGTSLYWLYDDLSQTMCRGFVSEIGYSSYGVELTADLRLHHDLRFGVTLAAGRYLYDKEPYVELFDDYDLTTISSPTRSLMSGLTLGNSPQIATTANIAYFGLNKYIFNLSSSYAALRYVQPSIIRRSERLLSQAFISPESQDAALSQERLGDIFDVEISVMRFFWFDRGGRLSVRLSVDNLLGNRDRVDYARESNRISLQSVDGHFGGSTLRESNYQYCAPGNVQLSVGYLF
ncbi:MAG: hypothetical protein R3Y08_04825 [Rikenellaceae bacterium]